MTTIDIVKAYNTLSEAKLSGMADQDKFTVIRAMRVMKPVKQQYDDFVQDAAKRLRPEGFDKLEQKAKTWNDQHRGKKYADLTPGERAELDDINAKYAEYNKQVEQCVEEEAKRDQPLCYTKLSEEALGKLMAANPEWTAAAMLLVADALAAEGEGKEG